jgi:hypothetical protein
VKHERASEICAVVFIIEIEPNSVRRRCLELERENRFISRQTTEESSRKCNDESSVRVKISQPHWIMLILVDTEGKQFNWLFFSTSHNLHYKQFSNPLYSIAFLFLLYRTSEKIFKSILIPLYFARTRNGTHVLIHYIIHETSRTSHNTTQFERIQYSEGSEKSWNKTNPFRWVSSIFEVHVNNEQTNSLHLSST